MEVIAIVGTQWGDEGKGKLVDRISENSFCCARYNGGGNAGHTVYLEGPKPRKVAFHQLPCGILHHNVKAFIGNGTVLNLASLAEEIDQASEALGRRTLDQQLFISARAHLTFQLHILADELQEDSAKSDFIGTTKRGIGPTYAMKALRLNLRAADLCLSNDDFLSKYERLYNFMTTAWPGIKKALPTVETEVSAYINLKERFAPRVVDPLEFWSTEVTNQPADVSHPDVMQRKYHIVAEGANATLLDLNVGTYPFCTSSDTLVGGVGGGLSIPCRKVGPVMGVMKAYLTRVGSGPFPTEQTNAIGEHLFKKGFEYGSSTGRPRRCGWLDLQMMRYSHAINGYDCLIMTKIDVLSGLEKLYVCTAYQTSDNENHRPPQNEPRTGTHTNPLRFPADLGELSRLKPVYHILDGWQEDISGKTQMAALPRQAIEYIDFIERELRVPITHISTGPERHHIIFRKPLQT